MAVLSSRRPDRYQKALDRADVVILDLEDAVAPQRKAAARDAVQALAQQGRLDRDRTVVRLNAADTPDHTHDLELMAAADIQRVMLAKSEHPDSVAAIDADVVALIETARGVERAGAIAETANVIGLMWGADDLVAGMGGTSSRHPNGTYRDIARYARSRTLIAAKACSRLALDGVHIDIADAVGLEQECADAVAVGFDASVAIHPSQVPTIRASYLPDQAQIDWARRLLEEAQRRSEGGGVFTFEGRMVDGPVFRQAEQILMRASRLESVLDG